MKTILLIEDNDDDIDLTLRALKKNKIMNDIVIARDGEEALHYLFGNESDTVREVHPRPSLVLLDLKIPKIDGLDVLQKIRANPSTKLMPIVILTSSKEEQDLIKSYSLGANSYVRKPVDFHQFVDAIQQLGLYWLIINETPTEKGHSHG
jgi:two-component system response regulator